jgi:hypothetical protein
LGYNSSPGSAEKDEKTFTALDGQTAPTQMGYHQKRFGQLKNILQIERTRHRSLINCIINILAGLIAYCHQSKEPSSNLSVATLLSP